MHSHPWSLLVITLYGQTLCNKRDVWLSWSLTFLRNKIIRFRLGRVNRRHGDAQLSQVVRDHDPERRHLEGVPEQIDGDEEVGHGEGQRPAAGAPVLDGRIAKELHGRPPGHGEDQSDVETEQDLHLWTLFDAVDHEQIDRQSDDGERGRHGAAPDGSKTEGSRVEHVSSGEAGDADDEAFTPPYESHVPAHRGSEAKDDAQAILARLRQILLFVGRRNDDQDAVQYGKDLEEGRLDSGRWERVVSGIERGIVDRHEQREA